MENVDLRYDAFRDRAGGKDGPGTAVALVECSHLYESIFAVPRGADISMLCSQHIFSTLCDPSLQVDKGSATALVATLQTMLSNGASELAIQQTLASLQENLLTLNKLKSERVEDSVSGLANTSLYVTADIFTSRAKHLQLDIAYHLVDAVRSLENEPSMLSTGLIGVFVLRSIDQMSCVVLGLWKSEESAMSVYAREGYHIGIMNAKTLAAEGTFSDIVKKTNSRRLFSVSDSFFFDKSSSFTPSPEELEDEKKYYFNLNALPKELL